MCFSPEASFTGSAVLAVIGIASLNVTKNFKHLFLIALMPLLFSIQQAGEGFVWLGLREDVPHFMENFGKDVFILFAYGIWPIYVPVAFFCSEPKGWRKSAMFMLGLLGIAVVTIIFMYISLSEITPQINLYSIRYINEPSVLQKSAYLVCVTLPFLLSSIRYASIFGVAICVAFFLTNYFYFTTFTSTWCFFGSLCSIYLFWLLRKESLELQKKMKQAQARRVDRF